MKFIPNCQEQADFIRDETRHVAYIGGRGAGKSSGGAVKLLRYIGKHPNSRHLVTANFEQQLEEGAIPELYKWAPDGVIDKVRHSPYTRFHFKNGCEIILRPSKIPDNLRAGSFATYWMDEGAGCSELAFKIGLATLRQQGFPHQMWLTSTPRFKNWVYRTFKETTDPTYACYDSVATNVNRANLTDEFIASLLQSYGGGESNFAKQEVYGQFVGQEGLVYSLFDRRTHCNAPPRNYKWRSIVAGVDWGNVAAWALVVVGLGEDGRFWCLDEYYKAGITINEFTRVCKSYKLKWPIERFCCDGTNPQAVGNLVNEGLRAMAMTKRGQDWVLQGIQKISALMEIREDGGVGINIHPKLENLIREIEHYRWPDRTEEQNEPGNPVKRDDHALDATRYAIEYLYSLQNYEANKIGKVVPMRFTRAR